MIKIIIDVMGTDCGIAPIIKAADAILKNNLKVHFIFVGDEQMIMQELNETFLATRFKNWTVINANEVITMNDGILAIRRKENNSMAVAIEQLTILNADAVISGGATGPFIAACHLLIGELPGVKRPGFMPFIPTTTKNKVVSMIDVGANLENDAEDLYNFALLANVYYQKIFKIKKPRVGLLNIGTEPGKGKSYQQVAYQKLQAEQKINFIGNIEPREITNDAADVIVTDGYSGNIALKSLEGMGKSLMVVLKDQVTKNLWRKILAFFLKSALIEVKETFNYKNYACALVLGLKKVAVKTHGNSNVKAWISTFKITLNIIESKALNILEKEFNNNNGK